MPENHLPKNAIAMAALAQNALMFISKLRNTNFYIVCKNHHYESAAPLGLPTKRRKTGHSP
jgi:hypothetical protein